MQKGQIIRPYQTLFNTYFQLTMDNMVEYRLVLTSRKTYMHDIKHVVGWTADRDLRLQLLSHDNLVEFYPRLECMSVSSPSSSSMRLISPSSKMPQGRRLLKQPDDTGSGKILKSTPSVLFGP